MKFDQRTNQILKNFSGINPSIYFREGDVLKTLGPSGDIIAKAKIAQTIEQEFAIYDLSRFISTLSMFTDPTINFEKSSLSIQEGNRKLKYVFTDPDLIITPPENDIDMSGSKISFEVSADQIQELFKALRVLSLPEISVVGNGSKILMRATNNEHDSSNSYEIEVGETTSTFNMIFKSDSLKMIPDDYTVSIDPRGISHWAGNDIEYWITVDSNSSYSA